MIEIRGLTYRYPGSDQPALTGIDLSIPRGQFCALLGANGAGKSSLCFALTGFVPHFYHGELHGQVQIGGRQVPELSLADLAGEVGLVFSNPFNQITGARFTVEEEIAFGLENLGMPRAEMLSRIDDVLALTGLSSLKYRSPYALSGGQQQRLALASVLAMRPQLLVLDEPTSQLDPVGTHEVFEILHSLASQGETTVVLAEQKLEWVATFADRVIILSHGHIVADGPPSTVLASSQLHEYGVRPTRYTEAAKEALAQNLLESDMSLPINLQQATSFFS